MSISEEIVRYEEMVMSEYHDPHLPCTASKARHGRAAPAGRVTRSSGSTTDFRPGTRRHPAEIVTAAAAARDESIRDAGEDKHAERRGQVGNALAAAERRASAESTSPHRGKRPLPPLPVPQGGNP
ncbi:hypothetical protein GCM10018965_020170 [Nonomuraea roseola]